MPSTKRSIRRAKEEDISAIIDLCQHSIRSTCTADYSPLQIEAWCHSVADPAKWKLAINCQYFILAEEAGKLLGFASGKYGEYLVYLYVHPAHQKTGVASLLMDNLLRESLRLNKNYIWANVSKTAQAFFRNKGFRIEHERTTYLNNVEIRNHRMGLYLGNNIRLYPENDSR